MRGEKTSPRPSRCSPSSRWDKSSLQLQLVRPHSLSAPLFTKLTLVFVFVLQSDLITRRIHTRVSPLVPELRARAHRPFLPLSSPLPDLTFNLWDIGGQTALRQSWSQFYTKTKAVVVVIDSSDPARLGLVREELGKLMAAEVSAGSKKFSLGSSWWRDGVSKRKEGRGSAGSCEFVERRG